MAKLKYKPRVMSPFEHVDVLIDNQFIQSVSPGAAPSEIERGTFVLKPGKHTVAIRTGSVETEPVVFETLADELLEVEFVGKAMTIAESLGAIFLFAICMGLLAAGSHISPPWSYVCLISGGCILVVAMMRSAKGYTVRITKSPES